MEVVRELHMNAGTGENSYVQNSLLQQKVIFTAKPIIEKAVTNLCCSSFPESIAIADFGCSSGPNTLFAVSEIIKAVETNYRKLGHQSPEYHVFLNDLPSNDFNTIFKSLPSFQEKLKEQSIWPCFFYGVPGSFHGRLLPHNSGVVDKEKLDSFNVPFFTPSMSEVISEIEKDGSFLIDELEISEQHWNPYHDEPNISEAFKDPGYNVAKYVRSVIEPLFISHFGFDKAIMDEVFDRYKAILNDYMTKEKTEFVYLMVSVIKKE
ncbi:S-adenosyl-L-methionine:salicylic acid carboxyl methyltransferase, putative [Ricinus communis]|uniref:S-adenosyl-L-methionine:salicylic acid carboxyl methyltransferase, putative n=1 Tax=Ricinus communis TaxID=3988 RepID=B9STC4_RICCO|nr:S-adenosyl-L-methionine:salicylic acid carboxyl methyltransferase, putative [Ricinus communis]|eukprot:XP_025014904.1 salicylate carboxymethyltransferase [Ricinus communis]